MLRRAGARRRGVDDQVSLYNILIGSAVLISRHIICLRRTKFAQRNDIGLEYILFGVSRARDSGNFDCLDDDLEAGVVGVTLYDEKSTPVWQSYMGATEGSFSVYGSGRFELCIQNGRIGSDDKFYPKDGIAREVGFAIRVASQSQRGMEGGKAGPDDRLTSHLLEQSAKLMDGLHTMMDHQEYMRGRENKHSVLTEMTFNRVVQWTVLEAIVLALIACGQVLYLKKFFEQRRYL